MNHVNTKESQIPVLSCWDDIITCSPEMIRCIDSAKIFAQSGDPVLIYGETGTGKELFVEAMVNENSSHRAHYVVQNCAAIPENLFESILFGSTRGAFTGAENTKGLLELADGGILFLDELNSMPLHLQPKLLRVMQDGKIRPIGSHSEKKVDVKIIAAMNRPPLDLIKTGLLREDLFYRFSSGMICLPPLRDRKEDIPLYISHFMQQFNDKYEKNIHTISDSLKEFFFQYSWPGNVRELKNVLDFCIRTSESDVPDIGSLPLYMEKEGQDLYEESKDGTSPPKYFQLSRYTLKELLETAEKDYIQYALACSQGNVTRAAELLGLPRQTLRFRMDKLQITSPKKK